LRISSIVREASNVIEPSQPIHGHATAPIHNPLRPVQSRTTDFVSIESYPHDRDRA
jgi:hypothetical protein